MDNYGPLEEKDLVILSGEKIKMLKDIGYEERLNILRLKENKYLSIFNILSTLNGKTDAKSTNTQKRYYRALFFIYYDILKIRKNITNEGGLCMATADFMIFEREHKGFLSALSSYRENFLKHKMDKELLVDYLKGKPQEEVIKLIREVLLEKRLGIRKYPKIKKK